MASRGQNCTNSSEILTAFGWCCFLTFFLLLPFLFLVSRGENACSQTQEVLEQVERLKAQISELDAQERELDNQKALLEDSIKHLSHDPITDTYPFMSSLITIKTFSFHSVIFYLVLFWGHVVYSSYAIQFCAYVMSFCLPLCFCSFTGTNCTFILMCSILYIDELKCNISNFWVKGWRTMKLQKIPFCLL